MEVIEQPKLAFEGVNIVNVIFNAKKSRRGKMDINVDCRPFALMPKSGGNHFSIAMDITVNSESFFDLAFRAIGTFKLNTELSEEKLKKKFINTNAAAIMFPYIRSFITTFTASIGNVTGTLTIPPQFFSGTLEIKEV